MAGAHGRSAAAALVARLGADPSSPWLTDVDLVTGTRTELSVTSAVNAVAKAAHLVGGQVPADGRQVAVALRVPLHWQTVTLVLGSWLAGARVVLGDPSTELDAVDAVVLGPEHALDPPDDLPDTVWGTRLHPLGLGFDQAPPFPVEDLAPLLRAQSDVAPPDRARDDSVAAELADGPVTHAELADRAGALTVGLGAAARLLTTLPLTGLDGLALATAVPTRERRSVVVVRSAPAGAAPEPALARLCALERVTVTAGVDVSGLPRLA